MPNNDPVEHVFWARNYLGEAFRFGRYADESWLPWRRRKYRRRADAELARCEEQLQAAIACYCALQDRVGELRNVF